LTQKLPFWAPLFELRKKILSADYADYTDFKKKLKAVNYAIMCPFDLLTTFQCHKDVMH